MCTKHPVYWLSPLKDCQVCHGEFRGVMYDARLVRYNGSWGNICQRCFDDNDCTLGLGLGQKYELQLNGKWLKTGG